MIPMDEPKNIILVIVPQSDIVAGGEEGLHRSNTEGKKSTA